MSSMVLNTGMNSFHQSRDTFMKPTQSEPAIIGKNNNEESIADSEDDVVIKHRSHTILNDFFYKEPCLYSHTVFRHAAVIFNALKHDIVRPEDEDNVYLKRQKQLQKQNTDKPKMNLPNIDFANSRDKRLSFELAFNTLKYQQLLEDILDECGFYARYPEYKEDDGVVMVMLYDLQSRKFQRRQPLPDEEMDDYLSEIEEEMFGMKTRMNAVLARNRIKANAQSIEHMLPENVRAKNKVSSRLPTYAWINQIKISTQEIVDELSDSGYQPVNTTELGTLHKQEFCLDNHCTDVLVFAFEQRQTLMHHPLVENGKMVIQDKSSSFGPHSVKHLINDGDDVIHVNVESGVTTAHLSNLLFSQGSQIFAFGIHSQEQLKTCNDRFQHLGVKNVKVLTDDFLSIDPDDVRFKHTKVILITAECSKSGITNPVDFIVNEGEDAKILHHLSADQNDASRVGELVAKHSAALRHAMKFTRVQAVVYTTRSIDMAENESVITRCVEYINTAVPRKHPWTLSPPVIPLGEADSRRTTDRYLKFSSTAITSGCFIAVITRELDELRESAKDVIARAAGLLEGVGKKEKKKKSERKTSESDAQKTKSTVSPRRVRSTPHKPGRKISQTKRMSPTRRPPATPGKLKKKQDTFTSNTPSSPALMPMAKDEPMSVEEEKPKLKLLQTKVLSFPGK